ncbi:hypothetical protein ACPYO6_12315 [Georgenia sp. Z1344]|uniref:hypothetical protein n=1 Tax=Georgenia sp. Z1344 TaxID=3416706 RepID=UPI003CEF8B6B
MNITHKPVRRSLVAAAALGAGLTLAACGGGDDEETTTTEEEAPETEEEPEAPSDGGETESDAAETGSETESDDAAGLPPETESEAGSAGAAPGGESESGATGEERIEITWPEGWEDLSAAAGEMPIPEGVEEMHAYGTTDSASFATNVTAIRYAPGIMGDGSYIELLEQSGQDTSAYTELEPRDIDGNEAEGLEFEQDAQGTAIVQRAYGFQLEDGSFVEIVLSSSADEFEANEEDFNAILDSITIN